MYAKVITHSQAPNGEELITMEIELHRFILPEFNTHRVFSRNFQSSRAVPIKKMIEQVRNNPAIPVHFGKNQRGMVAEEALTGDQLEAAKAWWLISAQDAAYNAEYMDFIGIHKQVVNRVLEPYMWTKGVVTATKEGFEGFFKLRCHRDAQPEIQALAFAMKDALEASVLTQLDYGDYHLPYIIDHLANRQEAQSTGRYLDNESAVKIATSCTAQVSYRSLDQSLDKALKIYDMLNLPVNGAYPEDPPHFSPTEHVAKVVKDYEHESFMGGNFSTGTFWQYRKALEEGAEELFLR